MLWSFRGRVGSGSGQDIDIKWREARMMIGGNWQLVSAVITTIGCSPLFTQESIML